MIFDVSRSVSEGSDKVWYFVGVVEEVVSDDDIGILFFWKVVEAGYQISGKLNIIHGGVFCEDALLYFFEDGYLSTQQFFAFELEDLQ